MYKLKSAQNESPVNPEKVVRIQLRGCKIHRRGCGKTELTNKQRDFVLSFDWIGQSYCSTKRRRVSSHVNTINSGTIERRLFREWPIRPVKTTIAKQSRATTIGVRLHTQDCRRMTIDILPRTSTKLRFPRSWNSLKNTDRLTRKHSPNYGEDTRLWPIDTSYEIVTRIVRARFGVTGNEF